ncbi:MAG: hypothetical protein IPI65_06135 [Bacteroidetes bacterium]|nr:hypothetical protein [Bacteroidota bacterium]
MRNPTLAAIINRDTVPGYLTYDYWIVKINSAGNVMWDKTLGAGSDDILNTMPRRKSRRRWDKTAGWLQA